MNPTTTHAAAQPAAYTVPPKRRRTDKRVSPGKCRHKTPCGDECILRSDKRHVYHTCNDDECNLCHGYERFGRTTHARAVQP